MTQVLTISNGTTTIDLLNGAGINLLQWTPKIAQWKDGGVVQDSKIADGKRLRYRAYDSVTETFRLYAVGASQDDCIDKIQDLGALLEQAIDYWLEPTNDTPVYLSLKSDLETNTRYAVVNQYKLEELPELYNGPFRTGGNSEGTQYPSVFREFVLVVDRGHWQDVVPGDTECVRSSSVQAWGYDNKWAVVEDTDGASYYGLLQTSSGKILVGMNERIFLSIDDGLTWALAQNIFPNTSYSLLQTTTGKIISGENGRAQKSTDDGVTFTPIAGFAPTLNIRALIQLSSGTILAGETNGIWRSDDDGVNWASVFTTYSIWSIIQTSSGKILAATSGRLYQSVDDGLTWTLVTTVMSSTPYLIQLSSGKILASGGSGTGEIWQSTDDGISWGKVAATSGVAGAFLQTSSGMILNGMTSDLLYSDNYGLDWYVLTTLPTAGSVSIIRTTSGAIIASTLGEVIRLSNSLTNLGASLSCDDKVYIANKQNLANLTNIYRDDGGVFSANLFPMTLPTTLFPATPAVNDATYFGIDTTITDSGPFASLVFDISIPASSTASYTITWEYWTGAAWAAITVKDGTNSGVGALSNLGVNSVHWTPPSNWAAVAVNSVTGYWVRARVSALAGTLTPPVQQNRNIYSCVLPYVDIDELQVVGDIPAVTQIKAHNRSDYNGIGSTSPDLYESRLLIGSRQTSRGTSFQSYINISDEQNPFGVSIALGTNTAFSDAARAPTGRLATYNPGGAEAMASRATITFGPTIARDFYGTHHAFVRVCRTAGVYTDFQVRLQVANGSGGVTFTTDSKYIYSTDNFYLIDFGRIQLPISGQLRSSELADSMTIAIQASSASGTPNLYIHDLILMPTDEWSADCVDTALETDSEVGRSGSYDKYLDIDSTNPKQPIKSLVRRYGSDLLTSVYKTVSSQPAQLKPNVDQRLWFLAARAYASGTHTGADNASSLTDAAAGLLGCGVKVGMIIYNATDGSSATITAVTNTTVAGTLAGGTGSDWDTNDVWYVICPNWVADPEICNSIQLNGVSRYLYPRGSK